MFLVVDDILNLKHIKVEGKTDDIELVFNNGSNVFVQAKSQLDPYNTSNTNKHLENGLKTLVNTSQQSEYSSLCYGTNINNPFVIKKFEALFSGGPTKHSFNELPSDLQNKIKKTVDKVSNKEKLSLANFDLSKLQIITLPFYGEDDNTRYRYINDKLLNFLGTIGLNKLAAMRIIDHFFLEFNRNSSKSINIEKKDLAWSIIVFSLDNNEDDFFEEFDIDMAEEDAIQNLYTDFIEHKSLEFTFLNEVRHDFTDLYSKRKIGSRRDSTKNFINRTVNEYEKKLFHGQTSEFSHAVTKFILWKILKKRLTIDRIGKEIGL